MAFDPDQFLAETGGSGFDPDKFLKETEPKSLGGFANNAWNDAKGTASGVVDLGKGLLTHPIDTATNVVEHLPGAVIDEGKRLGVGELLTGHPVNAIEKFGQAAYDKPVSTALDVIPVAGAAGKAIGIGGDVARGAEMASEAGAAATKALPAAEQVAKIATEGAPTVEKLAESAPAATAAEPSMIDQALSDVSGRVKSAVKQPMDDVGSYLEKKYGQIAQKPGWPNTVADYMKEHARNMTLKELGAAPGQVRKIGVPRAHELADYALEKEYAGPSIGTIGREQKIARDLNGAGAAVGGFRKIASDRGAVHNVDDLVNQIKANLDQKYLGGGIYSGDKGLYAKALQELKKAGPRAEDVSGKITDLFKESKNLDRLKRPSGPLADVARQARQINEGAIAKNLSPQELAAYENSLEDYGALTQLNEFSKRRASTEAGGRLGPGAGLSRALIQKFLDEVGYRTQAKVASKLSDFIRQNPEIAQRPRDLFRKYVDEAADAVDEMGGADVGQ